LVCIRFQPYVHEEKDDRIRLFVLVKVKRDYTLKVTLRDTGGLSAHFLPT